MNILLAVDLVQQDLRRQRIFRDRLEPLQQFSEVEIKRLFRFEPRSLVALVELVETDLERATQRNKSLTPMLQLCLTLSYLGTGSFQQNLSALGGIDQSTMSRCYWKVVRAINVQLDNIHFPEPGVERTRVSTGFRQICQLPDVIGAIDCTHVRIQRPPNENFPDEFINRKNYHSINVQAVCDASYQFLEITAQWPGSVHDSRIFRNSFLFGSLLDAKWHGYLVGDSGYRLYDFLLTPYQNPEGRQRVFNRELSRARVRIEQTFGILKRRFNCIGSLLRVPLNRIPTIIVTCCKLHNFARIQNDPHDDLPEYLVQELDDQEPVHVNYNANQREQQRQTRGRQLRDQFSEAV